MVRNVSPAKVILSAASTTWLYRCITAINGLVSLPIVLTGLGKTEYGIWVMICQSINLFAYADLGVGTAIGRFIARYRGLEDQDSLDKLFSTTILLLLGGAVLVILLTLFLAPFIPDILKIHAPYQQKAISVFIIIGFSLAFQFPLHIGIGFLTGYQYYGPHNIGKIATALLNLSGILLLFAFHQVKLIPIALTNAVTAVAGQIILVLVAWRLTRPWKFSFSLYSKQITRDLLSLGSSYLMIKGSYMGYRFSLSLVLARMLSMDAVAIYNVALTIIENIQSLLSSLSSPFSTLASELHAGEKVEQLRKSVNSVMRVSFTAAVAATCGLYWFSEPILRFLLHKSNWSSQDFINVRYCLLIMGFGMAVGLPQAISQSVLQGVGKHWYVSYSMILFSICSVVTSIVTIHFGAGVLGAAIGWSCLGICQGLIVFPILISKFLKQKITFMMSYCYLPGIFTNIILVFLFFTIGHFLPLSNRANLLIALLLCCFLAAAGILISSGYFFRIVRRAHLYLTSL